MSFSADLLNICCDILYEGTERLGMDLGLVSRIEGGRSEVVAVVPPSGLFQPGDTVALDSTYCREIYRTGEILALTEFNGSPGLQEHPCYFSLGAEAYLGAPIFVDQEIWGTVTFSAREIRPHGFEPDDLRFVKRGAEEIATACTEEEQLPAPQSPMDEEAASGADQPVPACIIPLASWSLRTPSPAGRA